MDQYTEKINGAQIVYLRYANGWKVSFTDGPLDRGEYGEVVPELGRARNIAWKRFGRNWAWEKRP